MKLIDMQSEVDKWVSNPNYSIKYFPPFEICAQLTEEVGEICREISHIHGNKKKKEKEQTDGLECEIGDVLFALTCLANSHDISLESAFNASMNKKNNRDSKRFLKDK
jgi:NTP pyrophosphatase (non-canonical NTP hydrolase)